MVGAGGAVHWLFSQVPPRQPLPGVPSGGVQASPVLGRFVHTPPTHAAYSMHDWTDAVQVAPAFERGLQRRFVGSQ
jgi:hypothetical protein